MLLYEYKLRLSPAQQAASDEAIRITPYIRNTCLRLWREEHAGWEPRTCRRPAAAWPTRLPSSPCSTRKLARQVSRGRGQRAAASPPFQDPALLTVGSPVVASSIDIFTIPAPAKPAATGRQGRTLIERLRLPTVA